eukprot:11207855-Lingulodinium_polyedra.AAC.1
MPEHGARVGRARLWCGCSPVTLKSQVLWLQDPEIREVLETSRLGGPTSTYGAAKSEVHFGGPRSGAGPDVGSDQ